MSVADLFNVPTTKEEFITWSAIHQYHHRDMIAYIQRSKSLLVPQYAIDPFIITEQGLVAYQHQLMHSNNAEVLNIQTGYDLLDVDWSDIKSREQWVFLNASTHYQEALASGVW